MIICVSVTFIKQFIALLLYHFSLLVCVGQPMAGLSRGVQRWRLFLIGTMFFFWRKLYTQHDFMSHVSIYHYPAILDSLEFAGFDFSDSLLHSDLCAFQVFLSSLIASVTDLLRRVSHDRKILSSCSSKG